MAQKEINLNSVKGIEVFSFRLKVYISFLEFFVIICYTILKNDCMERYMLFSEKVKYVRMKLFLSQASLAKELKVSFATINRWENQNIQPQLVQLGKFNEFCKSKGLVFEETAKENT